MVAEGLNFSYDIKADEEAAREHFIQLMVKFGLKYGDKLLEIRRGNIDGQDQ